ncbi:MAG: hypothetical protein KAI70_00710 [Candidatus Omnitrophica bacterium]|nr:hypothetical protein [Candidatus Omnitrophota bacterium]
MATITEGEVRSKIAGEDLSDSQYMYVTLESDNTVDLADGITNNPYGILQNAPESGQEALVKVYGASKLVAGGALAVDVIVSTKSDGKAQEATLTQFPRSIVTKAAGAEDDLCEVELFYASEELGGADEFASLTVTDHIAIASTLLTITDAVNFVFGTTTGTEIGEAADQKLSFHGATPVVQQAHVADPAANDAATQGTYTSSTTLTDPPTKAEAEAELGLIDAELDKVKVDIAAGKTATDANNVVLDSILATLETYGLHATS